MQLRVILADKDKDQRTLQPDANAGDLCGIGIGDMVKFRLSETELEPSAPRDAHLTKH